MLMIIKCTVVQIQNIKKLFFPLLLPRLDTHAGCQIEDTQLEQAYLTMEGNKPYTIS